MLVRGFSALGAAALCVASFSSNAQTSPDLIFKPIAPCTIFDTTKTARLTAGQSKSFYVSGTVGFPSQGGAAGGCGVPTSATAVALSLTAINGGGAGRLTVYSIAPRPDVRSVSYAATVASTAGVVAELRNGRTFIYTDRAVNVVGAVTGYFEPQLWALFNAAGVLEYNSGRVLTTRRIDVGRYAVTFDRSPQGCNATATSYLSSHTAAASPIGNEVFVYVYDATGALADHRVSVQVMC